MQITETSSDGLKRELKVVIAAGELNERFSSRLDEIKDRVQLKGFRKGKVPVGHLKKVFGRSLMAEVLQQVVEENSRQVLSNRNERPAVQPRISLPEDQAEIERVMTGQADLAFGMSFEVLPAIELTDFTQLDLERLTADVEEAEIDKGLAALAERNTTYEPADGRAASEGDRLTIDFLGKIDGEPFEGGSGEDRFVVLGQGAFLPDFEAGLEGARAGEARTIEVTFPTDYSATSLAGKTAVFEITVKEVAVPRRPEVADELAHSLGMESLGQLRERVGEQIKRELDAASRRRLKRVLLDKLDQHHHFALPPSLVDSEFQAIWRQAGDELERAGKTFADEGKTEESAREEYRRIAERRVRLGLILGEVGDKNKIQVTQEELRRALVEQARQFPGQERMVYEFYEKNPGALAQLRAPIFEEKVVDLIVELAGAKERKVSSAELFKDDEEAPVQSGVEPQ
jgi:trigger factor